MNERELELAKKVADNIIQFGVHLMGVFPTVDDPEPGPGFIYTIGLATVDPPQPELIVFGMSPRTGGHVLNDLADRVTKKGERLQPYQNYDDVIVDYPVMLIPVDDSTEHLTWANAFFGLEEPVPALQMVWTDKAGRYPWEEGYDIDLRTQPLLGQPPQ